MARAASRVDVVGPLEPYQVGFEVALADMGYTPLSAANQVRLMRHLSVWLEARDLGTADLAPVVVQEYLARRRADGYTCWLSLRGLAPLLTYLRGLGVAPDPVPRVPSGPVDVVLERYRRFLVEERGLVPTTVRYYLADARRFVTAFLDAEGSWLAGLDAADVIRFVVGECGRRSIGSAKILVTVMRSLLRFLLLDGVVAADLSGAVPAVAGWRGSHLPKGVTSATTVALMASCGLPRRAPGRPRLGQRAKDRPPLDVPRLASRRDRAILLLLARLGLRAAEVARLRLDDVDWRRGELVVRGKGRRDERLPLPTDVGEAVVGYLRHDRPSAAERALFLNVRVPYSPVTSAAVQKVVVAAAGRSGLAGVSAHRLRHTMATQMLQAEASLAEVGQVLRHRSAATTAIYAKVDRGRLAELAMAWPQVSR
jgi:site-specific recombinase XerD